MLGSETRQQSRTDYMRAEARAAPEERAGVGAFMGTVYAWMATGLGLSAFVAYECSQSVAFMETMAAGGGLFWALILSPFILIFVQAFRMDKGGALEGSIWYLLTTGIMGTWLSSVALQATEDPAFATVVFQALVVTVGMFGGMSITGWITRRDLSPFGNFFLAALWGLIAVGIVNAFMVQSVGFSIAYHIAGVVIFAGLVAYDTQQIKGYYYKRGAHHGLAVWGALSLYLDFVNIFLHLVQLMSGQSND